MICLFTYPRRSAPLVPARSVSWLLLALLTGRPALGADTLDWDRGRDRVSADIRSGELYDVLSQVAAASGWNIYVEPNLKRTVSTKFKNLPPGEALPHLLGELSFALVPQTNASPKLLVFRTLSRNATQAVAPALKAAAARTNAIPNQLIVRLKPGAKIEDLAKQLGAKVIGKIDSLNAYRLQFDDPAATDAARLALASNADVASVENNYSFDAPPTPNLVTATSTAGPMSPPQLQLKPPPDGGRLIIGLVDTQVQPLGNGLDKFLLPQQSVAGDAQLDPNTPAHGTSMAETMLRSLQTLTQGSTSVQILPVDVYGPNPTTSTFDVASGIAAAVNGGARIINLSLGSQTDSDVVRSVIQDATSQNIVFFGAAGNTHVPTPFYPAADPGVNAVTAIDQGQVASYADYGSFVTFGAPGTSYVNFQNQVWQVTGTSDSSAYMSGTIAGYMDANHATTTQGMTYLRNHYGVTITPTAGP